jgi:beta-galactosidase
MVDKVRSIAVLALLAASSWIGVTKTAQAQQMRAQHTFAVAGTHFEYDGKPLQIISGEMHYPRVPRKYWRDRLRKARAMGLNTITTYAFWNVHEVAPGKYDFSGENDIAEYIREAQQEGLHVILRPGPYVCAEWELGGYPSWLLKDPTLVLRSTDTKYNAAVKRWFARLSEEIRPLLLSNGGPIIAVQIENEYGAYGQGTVEENQAYLDEVKQDLIESGLGDALLFTSNQPGDLANGSLPGVPTVINFGTGDAHKAFQILDKARPDGPHMTGEYWAGWFDKWGEKHHVTDGATEAAEFRWMLEQGYSVSLYMFHGGTTFGWMNGADSHTGKDYHPDTTSYDYDAPLDERGEARYKFNLFRKAIVDVTHVDPPALPRPAPHKTFAVAKKMLSASLWRNLPTPVNSKVPLTFEDLDQAYGYVLYRTGLDEGDGGTLILEGLHDYAQVYVDQKLVGTLDRRIGTDRLDLPRQTRAATLDILVENTGRVNYSHAIVTERTGLSGAVTLDGKALANWENFSLPMDQQSQPRFLPQPCVGPCFFRTTMTTPTVADTYLDTRGLHKGQLWMGQHNLGRFWSVGPQYALYAPAPWMTKGETKVTFFDLLSDATDHLETSAEPIFGATVGTRENQ